MRASTWRSALCAIASIAALGLSAIVSGQDVDAGTSEETAGDPRITQLRALLTDSLDVSVEPSSLFEVSLDDDAAVQIEAMRIRALLRAADEAARPVEPPPTRGRRPVEPPPPEPDSLRVDLASVDVARWEQRLELDRARLAFYDLEAGQRAALLEAHAARQAAAQPRETDEERRAREAAAERERALEAARVARSEAERLVSEELARLIALENRVHASRAELRDERAELGLRRDRVLGWQRRVRDSKAAGAAESDATYDAIRRALHTSRDELATALDRVSDDTSGVPRLGADPLVDLPPGVSADAVRERRAAIGRAIVEARADERALREERAAELLGEIDTLNRERLGLLPHLSSSKRDAITGFTAAGWDQARSEARHLSLILRYHRRVASNLVAMVRSGGGAEVSPWSTAGVLVPLLLVAMVFAWGRRRTQELLRWSEERLVEADRAERRATPSVGLVVVRVVDKIHRPLEWIVFSLAIFWMLPSDVRDLLEVELVASAVSWVLAGALVIDTINAVAAGHDGTTGDTSETGRLRLRSLRLVGRTVVAFALILVLSARLVGEGTIYNWVFSTCWFAAIPVFLLLVRWWRGTVFERLDRLRKKSPLQTWILANRSGWKSFGAAMAGAVQLFAAGTIKLARSWLSRFDLARRVHAYLYKREIDRLGDDGAHAALGSISARALEALDPERRADRWLSCPADGLRASLLDRARDRRGGVIAVVAPRGMGKSTLLRELAEAMSDHAFITCRASTRLLDVASAVEGDPSIVLVDDAHTLLEPRIGGFVRFDEVVGFARSRGERSTWVVAVDASVWPLLKRARDARPLFDETHILAPWSEEELMALIDHRSEAAELAPSYEGLLDKLPPGADEIDRQDALHATRTGYERMVWDHVGGNPGLAMEVWRVSLGRDEAGVVHVRPLRLPDAAKLERLSDSSLFVLRAVLQLAPASAESVAQATRLRTDEVVQELRFGRAQGFYEGESGEVRISWRWLRAAPRLLERRHLLVTP